VINNFKSSISDGSIYLFPSEPGEIKALIQNLDNHKSPGIDNISVRVFKFCKNIISPIISKLVIYIFELGSYPDSLKIAKTIPIYKSGDSKLMGNYRPISLLNILNKIIEQVMHSRLSDFLNSNNFFYKFQYGFRSKSSTKTATIELFDKILNAVNNRKLVTGVFLDLAKAFDTVNHKILVDKLEYAGVRGIALNLFRSYLTDRKQTVYIKDCFSDMKDIVCGVPQGSVLGPLLFNIYINDIGNLNLKSIPNLFADDNAMFYFDADISENIRNAQSDLNILQEYFRLNKLTLNVEKSKFMNICPRNKVVSPFLPLKFNKIPLGEVSEYKYLGITIDNHLVWDKHINKIRNKIACRVGIIRKLSYFLPQKILLMLYYSLIHCNFEYLCLIWGSAANFYLKPIQVLQNRCLKYIYRLSSQYPTIELYEKCKILPIKGIYCQQICSFVNSVLNESEYHTIMFNFIDHDYETRYSDNNLYYGYSLNNFGINRISVMGPQLFNRLPIELKNCNDRSFKIRLKEWLIQPAQLIKTTKFQII
jgi:hypothetical protein